MDKIDFDETFKALTGNPPFPWQVALYENWFAKGSFPQSCNLPTGLGKTSVIAIWLIALINHPEKMPHRRIGLYGCCRFHGFNAVAPLKRTQRVSFRRVACDFLGVLRSLSYEWRTAMPNI